jgi:hypothetical protein
MLDVRLHIYLCSRCMWLGCACTVLLDARCDHEGGQGGFGSGARCSSISEP